MPTVLIIAPDFAPSSLPPATRVRFFVKHLPEFGWEPVVLTVDAKHYEAAVDAENQQLLSPSLEVIRTSAFSARWTRKFGVGDIGMRSLWQHWRAIKHLCRERKIDLIFIPVPPYVPMVLGRLAHLRFGIPYVIDYIEPWVRKASDRQSGGHRIGSLVPLSLSPCETLLTSSGFPKGPLMAWLILTRG